MTMKIDLKTLKGLNVMNGLLREQNLALKVGLSEKDKRVFNSLANLSGLNGPGINPFLQTPITSFNPLLQNNSYAPLTLDWTILMYAYKTHGIIQTMIDMPVTDALRGGIIIKSDGRASEDEIALLQDTLEEKGVLDVIMEARNWTRLFGGGALIVATDRPMNEPLDLKHLARTKMIELYACNRWELASPWRTSATYNFYGKTLDASRVRTMCGKTPPYTLRWQLAGWGLSELERFYEDFNTYLRVKNVIYELLYEAKVDVWKFKDFATQMLSAEAEAKTNQRMAIMNSQKSYNSAILMDLEDEYEQKQLTFSGLADIYRESRIELASSSHIPMTKLFGLPSTGLSTNEDDLEKYNGTVESEVRQPMRRDIRFVLKLFSIALFGDDYNFDFDYKTLRVLGAKEEEEIKTSKNTRYQAWYQAGLISPEKYEELIKKDKLADVNLDFDKNPVSLEHVEELDSADLPEKETFGTREKPKA